MIRYTYLLIDCLSLLLPLAFSFHPKIKFYKYWGALIPAIATSGLIYLLWDSWFTYLGIWGFNSIYITGIYLGNLPAEEIFFFICIPYACVFTFECISGFIPANYLKSTIRYINYSFSVIVFTCAFIFRHKYYTLSAFIVLAALLLIAGIRKVSWLPKFYIVYAVLLVPFLVVNGLLTGTALSKPVVWYNPNEIIGLHIITIPVEDVFYGMGLIMLNVWMYQLVKQRALAKSL